EFEELTVAAHSACPVTTEDEISESRDTANSKVKLRHEWDWKGVERGLRRDNEWHIDAPAAHQWRSAYLFTRRLYNARSNKDFPSITEHEPPPSRIPCGQLTPSEAGH